MFTYCNVLLKFQLSKVSSKNKPHGCIEVHIALVLDSTALSIEDHAGQPRTGRATTVKMPDALRGLHCPPFDLYLLRHWHSFDVHVATNALKMSSLVLF
ncbi:unnamed protein product, partial [Iphiclides podalirius]